MDNKGSNFVESERFGAPWWATLKEEMVAPYHKYIFSVYDGCGNHVIVRESR